MSRLSSQGPEDYSQALQLRISLWARKWASSPELLWMRAASKSGKRPCKSPLWRPASPSTATEVLTHSGKKGAWTSIGRPADRQKKSRSAREENRARLSSDLTGADKK